MKDKCIAIIYKKIIMKIMMTRASQNFGANLKRLS